MFVFIQSIKSRKKNPYSTGTEIWLCVSVSGEGYQTNKMVYFWVSVKIVIDLPVTEELIHYNSWELELDIILEGICSLVAVSILKRKTKVMYFSWHGKDLNGNTWYNLCFSCFVDCCKSRYSYRESWVDL